MSCSLKGNRNPNWKGGRSSLVPYQNKISSLKTKYNITETDFRDMMDRQKGCCAICKKSLVNPNFNKHNCHIDHDHKSLRVRGLLCHYCNLSLGGFEDSINNLREAIRYLEVSA